MADAPFGWTDENLQRLEEMLAAGGSAAEIAEALGCSRNSVIGKVHRLGLAFARGWGAHEAPAAKAQRDRAITVKASARVAPKPKPKPELPPAPKVDPTEKGWPKLAGPEAVTIEGLVSRSQCRMPLFAGSSAGGLYCGKPVSAEGSSWCAACRQLVYEARPIRAREEAEAQAGRLVRQASRSGAFA